MTHAPVRQRALRERAAAKARTATDETSQANTERRIGLGLIVFTFLFAFIVQSQFFAFSTHIHGDIEYHRGVAGTMLGGDLQGEGPLPGLLAYYGGLYPLFFGYGSHALGVSFEGFLSVVSWFATLALPAALLLLARRIWPQRLLEQAALVFVGTIGGPLALRLNVVWVNSLLPSGANIWPLFPRDIALILLAFALGIAMRDGRPWRYALAGAVAGLAICVQVQLGVLATGAIAVWALSRAGWPPRAPAFGRAALAATTAAVVSVWWWLPRTVATVDSRPLSLQSYPGRPPDLSPVGLVVALGATGFLALAGLLLSARGRDRTKGETFFLCWALACVPLIVVSTAFGDIGIMMPTRAWFLAAVPVVVMAARATAAALRTASYRLTVPLLVLVIVVPSCFEVAKAMHSVAKWSDRAPGYEAFTDATWTRVTDQLARKVRSDGQVRVLAPDNDALYIWSATGAQPFSFFDRGNFHLGFDPAKATGIGYLARVQMTQSAFAGGRPALCQLAQRERLDVAVLRAADGRVAFHDLVLSARWRVSPNARSTSTVRRQVAPGVVYEDSDSYEDVLLSAGATLPLGFSGSKIREVEVQVRSAARDEIPRVVLRLPDGSTVVPRTTHDGLTFSYKFTFPTGVPPEVVISARRTSKVTRVLGYEPATDLGTQVPQGATATPLVVTTAELCANPGN